MLFYREWAHYLYPEARFTDFLSRVRKECSSRTMKQYLHDLRRDTRLDTQGVQDVGIFAELDAQMADIKDMLKQPVSAEAMTGSTASGQIAMPDFEDLDFGPEDDAGGWSEEERLLDLMKGEEF